MTPPLATGHAHLTALHEALEDLCRRLLGGVGQRGSEPGSEAHPRAQPANG